MPNKYFDVRIMSWGALSVEGGKGVIHRGETKMLFEKVHKIFNGLLVSPLSKRT